MLSFSARPVPGLGEIRPGDDVAELVAGALEAMEPAQALRDGQVLSIAHKAISKAEGAVVELARVSPGARALQLAERVEKDPRLVQVILDQSQSVVRAERGVLICRTPRGFVCANAGVDTSNSRPGTVILHPRDPDGSARRLRGRLRELVGANPAVVISDSFGRAWRQGQCDVAIGCAGLAPMDDWRGRRDAGGLEMRATIIAVGDAVAAAADLARAKDSREPVVVLEGLERFVSAEDGPGAAALVRPLEADLFQ